MADWSRSRRNVLVVCIVALFGLGMCWSRDGEHDRPARSAPADGEYMENAIHRAALTEAVHSAPCSSPLAVYRLLGGTWTVGHEDGKPPRIQVESVLGVRHGRRLVERAEAIWATRRLERIPLREVLPGC